MTKPTSSRRTIAAKLLLVALFGIPAVLYLPRASDKGPNENRHLAPWPKLPDSVAALPVFNAQIDAWVNDHFGLRDQLVVLNTRLRYALFRQFPTHQIIEGKEGRLFLSTYQPQEPPYSGILSICGYGNSYAPLLERDINRLVEVTQREGINARLLVVPSSPVVNTRQLPSWVARLCNTTSPLMQQVLASPTLSPQARDKIYYPLNEMRQAAAEEELFPRTFFHWAGRGPRLVSDWTEQRFWGMQPQQATPYVSERQVKPSDVGQVFRGLEKPSQVEVMNTGASGIEMCESPACFGEALQPALSKVGEVSRYRNPKAPRGRLVLISDSFGLPAAIWFARYYKEVAHIGTNSIEQLNPAELEQLRHLVFDGRATDDVLVLYHDGTAQARRISKDFKALLPGF
ncbi:hypothetical protein GTP45_16680 [Pseudoduganella sp. FT55W]|uniref:AlgX/AlgJ SGNH hydrolase-like domain-containing protein n=1 Tax=Duganella rivi TaxID=2666083 RepID=A0A7X4KCK9_9BURK|nr:hypothetical protein [Duganella rivi]MYM68454.1 hypothetical protein [Duganella rivi]